MPELHKGTITKTTRRVFSVTTDDYLNYNGKILAKYIDLTVGDKITFKLQGYEAQLLEIHHRKNFFSRSYFDKTRNIAANLDKIFIVSAVDPLFNTLLIDKLAVAAEIQKIPISLIINKLDLLTTAIDDYTAVYKKSGYRVIAISVKKNLGIDILKQDIFQSTHKAILFTGTSGVGKSSLINMLFPQAKKNVTAVSVKTGQGKQTTSLAEAYVHSRENYTPLFVIDSPGIQNFGLTKLLPEQVSSGFPEIFQLQRNCKFSDCTHTSENNCAVIKALNTGLISQSRYYSYLKILEESKRIPIYARYGSLGK